MSFGKKGNGGGTIEEVDSGAEFGECVYAQVFLFTE